MIELDTPDLTVDQAVELFGEDRWYQIAAQHQVEKAIEEGSKRICIVMPTGTGKTRVSLLVFSSHKIRKLLGLSPNEKLKLLFCAHKHRLLTQAERTYAAAENIEFIPQSVFSDIPPDLDWHISCIDEFHHESCDSIQHKLDKLGNKILIGLTASNHRNDGCVIKYDVEVNPISREQAVREGWLSPTHIHSIVDVPSKDKLNILKSLFTDYADQMGNTFVFVKTRKEVAALETFLREQGHTAIGLIAQSDKELNTILDDFSIGKWKFIINCGKIGEGVDVKGCTDVVLGRQINSIIYLNQIIGRTTRGNGGESNCWELINPLSSSNLDSTIIVVPATHRLISKERGMWCERHFDHIAKLTTTQLGIASGVRIIHN